MARTPGSARGLTRSLLALACMTGLALGCNHVRYGTNDPTGVEHSRWSHFFFFGLIGKEEIAVRDLCPTGAARIHTHTSFVNGIVTVFPGLFGLIWTPRTVEITCKGGGSAVLELDGNGHAHGMRLTSPRGASERVALATPIAYTGPSELDAGAKAP